MNSAVKEEGETMSNLSNALQQLREEHKQAQHQVEKLQSAISVVEDLVGRNGVAPAENGGRPSRVISPAARKRMAAAQKARWAKVRKESQPAVAKTTTIGSAKRTMSASARRKIASAQRARWAKLRKAA
jgi:hypothetical protein